MRRLFVLVAVATMAACGSDDKKAGTDTKVDFDVNADYTGRVDAVDDTTPEKDLAEDTTPACIQGLRKCGDGEQANQIFECQGGSFTFITVCPQGESCANGMCVKPDNCTPGAIDGCVSTTQLKQCNEDGSAWVPVNCMPGEACLLGECKVAECMPGQAKCLSAEVIQFCGDDGTWADSSDCGGGKTCVGGKCLNECLSDPKWNNSYIGCEYWSLDLDNYPDPYSPTQPDEAPHGIILGNPGTATATITFKSFATDVPFNLLMTTVEPGDIRVIELPRMDIDGSVISNRSVRIVSNRPVVAYQFNPLDFKAAYSDDSSLLLPAEMLGTEYLILTYMTSPLESMPMISAPSQHGYFTVLAIEEGETTVKVRVAGHAEHPTEVGKIINPGEMVEFKLQQGQVLSLQSSGKSMSNKLDLSGSAVIADRRVAVFSGHEEAVVAGIEAIDPEADCCCAEHLEEQLFPVNTWADSYLCVKARPRGTPDLDLWRVQASQPNTTITTDPPIDGLHGKVLANVGDWVEAFSAESFVLNATAPVQVAQYLHSGTCTGDGVGDPALIMTVPQSRYRTPYAFAVPKDYSQDYITVVRLVDEDVMLDGVELPEASFTALGSTGYEYGYFPVADGPHMLESNKPFGLYQYGWQGPASYGHSGGLNLVVSGSN